jgi:hypothetical protein
MKNVNEILAEYTNGKANLEDTNAELKKAGAGFHLDPYKNYLSPDEIVNGTAGLLGTGTGSYDKVKIVNGELTFDVNQVNPDGTVNMRAFVLLQGKVYDVKGRKLFER